MTTAPALLAELRDLRLAATLLLDGTTLGSHGSRLPGAGFEFAQYRMYQPGDDLRFVDWRLFGRSDRYYVRESERETSVAVRVVLDASASMRYVEDGVSVWQVAQLLAAAIALLAERQGDAVGLVAAGTAATSPTAATEGGRNAGGVIAPANGRRHVDRLIHALEGLKPSGRWPAWAELERTLLAGDRRGIAVLISDLHEHHDEIVSTAARLVALRHDVIVLHLVPRREREFDWHGAVAFEDLETGARVEVDADAARETYLARHAARLAALRAALLDAGADYARVSLDEPLAGPLRSLLALRARR